VDLLSTARLARQKKGPLSRSGKIAAIQRADSTEGCHVRLSPRASDPLPPRYADRLAVFADLFTRPTWSHALVLLAGAILAPGRRTVMAVLRILGRERVMQYSIIFQYRLGEMIRNDPSSVVWEPYALVAPPQPRGNPSAAE
jgi:hypothetical protein